MRPVGHARRRRPAARWFSVSQPALLWAPCAGPILGLVLTGAALQGANVQTTLLLLAYSAGAATSLALGSAHWRAGVRGHEASLGAGEWVRRGLALRYLPASSPSVLVPIRVLLARLSTAGTSKIEQALLTDCIPRSRHQLVPRSRADGHQLALNASEAFRSDLPVEGQFPSLDGAVEWLNSPPLTTRAASRQGRAGRFLDLFLHQLHSHRALCSGLGGKVQGSGSCRDWRACAGIRLRKKIDNVKKAIDEFQDRLSGCDRQQFQRSGGHSRTAIGQPTTSSMPRARSGTTISAKATTRSPRRSSRICWPRRKANRRPRLYRLRLQSRADRRWKCLGLQARG